jgi:hypothetical protein
VELTSLATIVAVIAVLVGVAVLQLESLWRLHD